MKEKWPNFEFLVSSKKTITIAMSYWVMHLRSHGRKVKYWVANTQLTCRIGRVCCGMFCDHGMFCHQQGDDKLCRHSTFVYLDISTCDIVCVCVCTWVCVRVCMCVCTWGRGGWGDGGMPVCTWGCILTIYQYQMATVDAEILSTQHFKTLAFRRRHKPGGIYVLYS